MSSAKPYIILLHKFLCFSVLFGGGGQDMTLGNVFYALDLKVCQFLTLSTKSPSYCLWTLFGTFYSLCQIRFFAENCYTKFQDHKKTPLFENCHPLPLSLTFRLSRIFRIAYPHTALWEFSESFWRTLHKLSKNFVG